MVGRNASAPIPIMEISIEIASASDKEALLSVALPPSPVGLASRLGLAFWQAQQRNLTTDLRTVVAEKIPAQQERLKAIKKAHADKVIGDVTVGMCIGGMRGIKGMLWAR